MNVTFQRRTDLALLALRALSEADGTMSRRELASRTGTTDAFIAQVMSPLVDEGWVVSSRGPGGGYLLAPAAADLSLLDVVEAMEGPSANGRCVLRDGPCPGENCPVHAVWAEARRVLVEGFERVPVLDSSTQGAQP